MHFSYFLSWISLFACLALGQSPGTIEKPVAGTHIAPGSSFEFKYNIRADYSMSSYDYNVYLFTQQPGVFAPASDWSAGHFFGRFDEANYPGESVF
jgi:hypothetical protein